MPKTSHKVEEFKGSPIGTIPQDWSVVSLNDEITLLHGYAFEGEYFADEPPGEVLLVPGNFHREGGLYFEENNTKYYRGSIPESTVLGNGDLLIVMTDLSPRTLILGRVVQLDLPFRVLHNQRIGKIVPRFPDTWDKRFLMLAMNSDRVRNNIISTASGTTVRHTSPDRITANLIPKPRLEEQKRIVEILDTIDFTIAHTSTLIAKLKQMKAGLLHDLLTRGLDENGKLRDAIEHPEQFKDSPLGQIPEDWEVVTVQTCIEGIEQGWSPDCDSVNASLGEWGVLKTTSVVWDGYQDFENKRLPDHLKPVPEYEIKTGDVLMTRAGPNSRVGVVAYVSQTQGRLMLSDKLYRLKPRNVIKPEFLVYALSSEGTQRYLSGLKTGLAESQTNISQEIVRALLLALPLKEEQEKIISRLEAHAVRIEAEEAYLTKLKEQKKGLMHDLLTGRVRVTDLKEIPA